MADLAAVVIYPDLLGLYADGGNALAFRHRARGRGMDVEIIDVPAGGAIPSTADLYVLGGAEDASLQAALGLLREQSGLKRAVGAGASVLAVCAGLQLLGESFLGADEEVVAGLGLLAVTCRRLPGPRAVGEIAVDSPLVGEVQGFENHRGDARIGREAAPLGTVRHGVGNGHDQVEGIVQGHVVGTYLHGPVLVRNPALADHFLAISTGCPLPPMEDELVDRLRTERREAMRRHRSP